jgi:hypothetical protein
MFDMACHCIRTSHLIVVGIGSSTFGTDLGCNPWVPNNFRLGHGIGSVNFLPPRSEYFTHRGWDRTKNRRIKILIFDKIPASV